MSSRYYLAHLICSLGVLAAVFGCSRTPSIDISPIENPSDTNARLPNLTQQGDHVLLSWVEPAKLSVDASTINNQVSGIGSSGHRLRLAKFDLASQWSKPSTVSSGKDWFVNWADFPSVFAIDDHRLAAHWLQRSGESTYAYDVVTSTSEDGRAWSAPMIPHLDQTQTEHGFASFFAMNSLPAIAWLDGRNTKASGDGHAGHAAAENSSSAMTLRTRVLTDTDSLKKGTHVQSTLLDTRVCDCCQTTAVNTNKGAAVFYRDRSPDEVRDIAYVTYDANLKTWSKPSVLHDDQWTITGCPVNGPQAAALGSQVFVTWFTASPSPRVQLIVSNDNAQTFGEPVIVSDAQPQGRVAITALNSERILVSWLESRDTDSASIKIALFDSSLTRLAMTDVAVISAARQTGFPRMAPLTEHSALIAFTDWQNSATSIETVIVSIN